MNLEIITPEKLFYSGEVDIVTLPGLSGFFSVLDNHAPLISSLEKGVMSFRNKDGLTELLINGGFVEVNKNQVVICIEIMKKI